MSTTQKTGAAPPDATFPNYRQFMGFWDLFFIATGVIIGSGIMVMTGRAIGMTGRSICIAYVGSAIWVILMGIPTILMCSCIRLLGGGYTQANIFIGERFGGFFLSISLLGQMGHNLYAQVFATYFVELFGWGNPRLVAAACIIFFYTLNFFGIDKMSKAQNFMSALLLFVLIWFTIRGLPKVNFSTFFGGEGWMTGGFKGLFAASTLLTYALLGGTSLMPYSADAKNPRRDIPLAAALSTISIAILFALMGIVCSGILPLDQVANKTLSLIAGHVLSRPEYIVFMVGGALFAAATTLNGAIGSVAKSAVMMSHDGWLPRSMAVLHPKYNTPWKWQIFYFCMTMLPLILGFDISKVTDITLLGTYTLTTINIFNMRKLPKLFPEQWERSMFKMPIPIFKVIMWICFFASLSNVWGMITSSTPTNIAINVAVMVIGLIFSLTWYRSGRVKPSVSWTDA